MSGSDGGAPTTEGSQATSDDGTDVRIGVLGPFTVAVGGTAVQVDRVQVRRALALMVSAQGPISRDALTDELWPDQLPENPRRALQVVLSRCRSALGPTSDRLTTSSHDVQLDGVASDLADFERHAAATTTTTGDDRLRAFEAADAAWRGEAFSDTADGGVLERRAAELTERRRSVATSHGELLIELGQHDRAVEVLGRLALGTPHDERLAVAHARALAGAGRRSDALAALERTRIELRDTLGVGLSDLARSAEREILETSVQLPAAVRSTPTPSQFVGRADELTSLTQLALAGDNVLIVGEPGVGRTSLLGRLQGRLAEHGRTSVMVTAQRSDAPLDTIAGLTTQLLERAGDMTLDAREAEALGRIIPSHRLAGDTAPTSTRDEFIESLAQLVERLAAAVDAVVMIDDLHLLDPTSHDVMEQLSAGPVAVITTATPNPELTDDAEARSLRVHDLDGLSLADLRVLVGLRYGAHRAPDVEELLHRSGGNPSFVNMLIDLDLDGALDDGPLPTSLLVAVQERLSGLSATVLETLQVAALLGRRFELEPIRTLRSSAERDLSDAQQVQLIRIADDGDTGTFVHGLVADAALELLPHGATLALHDALGRTLDALGMSSVRVARHLMAAARLDPLRAVVAQRDAGSQLLLSHAAEEALHHLEGGVDLVEQHGLHGTAAHAELLVSLGRAQRLTGDPAHVTTAMEAIEVARRNGHADLLGRAVVELASHGAATLAGHTDDEMVRLVDEALDAEPSPPVAAAVMAAASPLLALTPDYRRGQQLFARADEIARTLDDRVLTAQVLSHTHLGYSHPADFARRLDARRRLQAAAGDDLDLHWEVAYLAFWEGVVLAEPDHMAVHLDLMRQLTPLAKHRQQSLLHTECAYLTVIGDHDRAERQLNEAAVAARGVLTESMSIAHYGSMLLAIRSGQGRLHELDHAVGDLASRLGGYANLSSAVALVAAESGRRDDAERMLDELAADDFAALLHDISWTASMWGLGRVAVACGRTDHAERIYSLLSPFSGTMSWAGTTTFGPVDTALAELADLLGRPGAALVHREVAATIVDGFAELTETGD